MSLCLHNISSETGLYAGLFLAGLAGGFTHCTVMCGPFALAQAPSSLTLTQAPWERLKQSLLFPYHLGRMTTYVMLAVVFSAVFNTALFFSPLKNAVAALLLLTAALIFIVNAVPLMGRIFPYLARITLPVPRGFILAKGQGLMRDRAPAKRFLLGMILGFMPCGLVVAALMTAVALPHPLMTAAGMALFALGTIPALILSVMSGQYAFARYPRAVPVLRMLLLSISTATLFLSAGRIILS
jgi:sulfite exporter TauE/SafE